MPRELVVKNGRPVYVLRPAHPERQVARALDGLGAAVGTERWRLATHLDPDETWTLVGKLARDGMVVDDVKGVDVGHTVPGDTFVTSLDGLGPVKGAPE